MIMTYKTAGFGAALLRPPRGRAGGGKTD